jgi:hypothetical protein
MATTGDLNLAVDKAAARHRRKDLGVVRRSSHANRIRNDGLEERQVYE